MISFFKTLVLKSGSKKRSRRTRQQVYGIPCEVLEQRLPLTLIGSETHVNTITSSDQTDSETAANASGNSVVVWTSRHNSSDTDVYAQRYNSSGQKVGGEITVARSSRKESQPAVSMDSSGRFVIVWRDTVSSSSGLNDNLVAQRYNADGSKRGGLISIASDSKGESEPSIASNSAGDFVVSYTFSFSSSDDDVKAKRYNDAGVLLSTFNVSTSASASEYRSTVARAPDGRFAIAYQLFRNSNNDIEVKRYAATGSLTNTHTVASGTNDQESPSVSMDNNANTVVAWQEFVAGDYDIKARTISNGGTQGSIITLASSSEHERDPDVSYRRSGGIYVVSYISRPNGGVSRVKVQEVTASTGSTRSSLTIGASTPGSSTGAPSIFFGSGNIYNVVYSAFSRSNDEGSGIFGRRGSV